MNLKASQALTVGASFHVLCCQPSLFLLFGRSTWTHRDIRTRGMCRVGCLGVSQSLTPFDAGSPAKAPQVPPPPNLCLSYHVLHGNLIKCAGPSAAGLSAVSLSQDPRGSPSWPQSFLLQKGGAHPHVRKTHAGASVLNDYRREDDFGSHAVMLCLLFLLLLVVSF